MDAPSPTIRDLARRLLALEAASRAGSDADGDEVVRVCEKLRVSLTRFAGPDGFASLQRRALALARAEVPALRVVTIKPDGTLEGVGEAAADAERGGAEATAAVTAHLLWLLVTFVGESLTFRLVRDAWPEAPLGND